MLPQGKRRREAREESARLQGRLTAFGELLAGHPFTADRPGATHVMAVEYARALDAYEQAARVAERDPVSARRELAEGLAALHRLNALLVGAQPADSAGAVRPPGGSGFTPKPPTTPTMPTAPKRPTAPEEAGTGALAETAPAREAASRPRLRERFTAWQLLVRAALVVLACYCVLVGLVGGWGPALACVPLVNFGAGLTGFGTMVCRLVFSRTRSAVRGGRVAAEYRGTERTHGVRGPWEQRYVHTDTAGRETAYGRTVPSPSLAAVPVRRLWLLEESQGDRTLITSTELYLTPLLLVVGVPLLLLGLALLLGGVPGMLIAVSTGLWS
ncbi:hypothetical protein [Streptomyces barringtoniae]|uniref:hypothetical protein n=1 Tax=Streptomyces barringtoniae TaxID=2892029 RepID=UPI001E58781F|nr:hypothetical protein [Streptomyces barringtoniae]MCC5478551.1 hypothetical protein [Streptomyces barringtoniae]